MAKFGRFIGAVVTGWVLGSNRLMQLKADFTFIDVNGVEWLAPKGSLIDGASIPRVFWVFIGSPFVGKYREASVVHDVYCKTKSRPHKEVHKMFYNAMRANDVGYIKAKAMYFAVRLGGPKW